MIYDVICDQTPCMNIYCYFGLRCEENISILIDDSHLNSQRSREYNSVNFKDTSIKQPLYHDLVFAKDGKKKFIE